MTHRAKHAVAVVALVVGTVFAAAIPAEARKVDRCRHTCVYDLRVGEVATDWRTPWTAGRHDRFRISATFNGRPAPLRRVLGGMLQYRGDRLGIIDVWTAPGAPLRFTLVTFPPGGVSHVRLRITLR